jgi:hypothetical protein
VGASDTYQASAPCPCCAAICHLSGQTKVFLPDFGELHGRHFTLGHCQPLSYRPSDMLRAPVWDDEWFRVRPICTPDELTLLVDLDETFACSCGQPMAPILRFALDDAAPSATLLSIDLRDALADDVAANVDLASAESIVARDLATFRHALHDLATSHPDERAARLHQALARRFEGHERWHASPDQFSTHLVGPMRCEACGTTRDRAVPMLLTHPYYEASVLGDGWSGGALRPGMRVASPMGWRAEDEDRGYFVRLRHPLPERTLTLCGGPEPWGCACGAGRAAVLVHLDVDDEGFAVRSLTMRVLRTPADLEDIDLAEAAHCSRGRLREPWHGRHRHPADRAEAIACLYREWGIVEPE